MVGRDTGVVQSDHVWQVRDRTCTEEEQRDVSETCCPGWAGHLGPLFSLFIYPLWGPLMGGQESVGKAELA